MTVLILDGGTRSTLAMVRSLGSHGISVHVGESYRYSLSTFSKYCENSVTYSNPEESRQAFISDLIHLLDKFDYEMVLASREVTTLPLSYFKYTLEEETTIPFPPWEVMNKTVDKAKTFELAEQIGVPTPKTYVLDDPSELANIESDLEYPLVVKPRSKTTWVGDTPVMMKVTEQNYVHNYDELRDSVAKIYHAVDQMPLIQEYIPGEGYGVELLCNEGESEALFMHRRLREYPITGGASTFRESTYESRLEEPAINLMNAMGWHGVTMVEFKLDERDGTPKLIEVNGRFWGSLPLAVAAGIDFPSLLYALYSNGSTPNTTYDVGVRSRWLLPGDVLWFLTSLIKEPNRLGTVREFSSFREMNYDILSIDDPYPAVGAARNVIKQGTDVLRGNRNLSGEVTR